MNVNYWAILMAAVADFIIGAIWYMPLFGKIWGEIHGFDMLSKKEQKEAQQAMGPYMIVQFIITVLTAWALAKLSLVVTDYSIYTLAFMVWIGFVVPTQVAAIVFGGTEPKWMVKKALIMAGASLACLQAAAFIIQRIS